MKILIEINVDELTEETADKLNEIIENNELFEYWEEVIDE